MQPLEIFLPETRPETEWIRGRALQKVSPTYPHGRLQLVLGAVLMAWADGRGRVASEWRFRVNPPGEAIRPLVPDLAYVSYRRIGPDDRKAARVPLGAPEIAVEILSTDDRPADVEDKIATCLRAGCRLAVLVDAEREAIVAIDAAGRSISKRGDIVTHAAFEDLAIDVSALFHEAGV